MLTTLHHVMAGVLESYYDSETVDIVNRIYAAGQDRLEKASLNPQHAQELADSIKCLLGSWYETLQVCNMDTGECLQAKGN